MLVITISLKHTDTQTFQHISKLIYTGLVYTLPRVALKNQLSFLSIKVKNTSLWR